MSKLITIALDFWTDFINFSMKIRVETMRLDYQADNEKKYEKTNKIEPEEYQQILSVRGIRAIDSENEHPEKKKENQSKRCFRN